ncbi:MAG: Ig-like domain-containing protein [Prevotella sp.]|nr:Ig-like domain-containing protein [Prevotella sp.]
MGSPDGGWYDETPPYVVSSTPDDKGINQTGRKVTINFNEYIKIEDAQNKVIVSPPQLEQADIKAQGKRIIVSLKDSLKPNTTYTIDFSDAISDNNEGNPMGNYTFSFSTGSHIDTLQVSGYCLNAEDLEPIKGILVGLYPYWNPRDTLRDSIFHKEPMMRVSRTNTSGQFTIKGVAPGAYRAFALNDADGDFVYGQKSETIGFDTDSIVPSWKPDTRQDTIWRDTLHIDNILRVPYTHFLPDDVTLFCFQETITDRSLIKMERKEPQKIELFFTYGCDSLPRLRGLNFQSDSAFVIEASAKKDTICYWLRDTTLINQDTLEIERTYLMTDTLGQLFEMVDTVQALPKQPYEKRMKEKAKELEKWQKEQEKKKKRDEPYDSVHPSKPLQPKMSISGQMTPLDVFRIEMPEPLQRCDTTAVHLYQMIDSVWYNCPHEMVQTGTRKYELLALWKEGFEYSLEIDSAAFQSIYGLTSKPIKQGIKVNTQEAYSTLTITLSDIPQTCDTASVVLRLLDTSGNIVRQKSIPYNLSLQSAFTFVKPGKYFLSAFIDLNNNGVWDTGAYDKALQPEPVYYHPEEIECKEKWDVTRQWNLKATPPYRQKPNKLVKQKPEKEKQLKNRNLQRAKELGKEYIKQTGINL